MSFIQELWQSILEPGVNPALVRALNGSFVALILLLLGMLFATGSIHFAILLVIAGSLWAGITWFVAEVKRLQPVATQPVEAKPEPASKAEVEIEKQVSSEPEPEPEAKIAKVAAPEKVEPKAEPALPKTEQKPAEPAAPKAPESKMDTAESAKTPVRRSRRKV